MLHSNIFYHGKLLILKDEISKYLTDKFIMNYLEEISTKQKEYSKCKK